MSTQKVFFKNSKGQRICGILEEPNRDRHRVVIIIHGYSTNKNRTSSLLMATELARRGINSLRIDLNGCGESEGDFRFQTITTTIDDTESTIAYVKRFDYTQVELFGASAGGLTAMAAALKHPEVTRLGLKCPVSDYVTQKIRKKGEQGIEDWKKAGWTTYIGSQDREYKIDYSVFDDYKNYIMFDKVHDIECPVLIVHGDADETVDVRDSKRLARNFPRCTLVIVPGANHKFTNDNDRTYMNNLFGQWFETGLVRSHP